MSAAPIDAWTRRRLRESKGLIVRKLRGVERWDVIDERSGRVLHPALDRDGMIGLISGTSIHDDLLTGVGRDERYLLVSSARRIVELKAAIDFSERFLADMVEQYGWDAATVAAVLEREELGRMMEGITS